LHWVCPRGPLGVRLGCPFVYLNFGAGQNRADPKKLKRDRDPPTKKILSAHIGQAGGPSLFILAISRAKNCLGWAVAWIPTEIGKLKTGTTAGPHRFGNLWPSRGVVGDEYPQFSRDRLHLFGVGYPGTHFRLGPRPAGWSRRADIFGRPGVPKGQHRFFVWGSMYNPKRKIQRKRRDNRDPFANPIIAYGRLPANSNYDGDRSPQFRLQLAHVSF